MKRIAFMVMLSISTALVYAQKNSVRIGFGYQRTWMVDRQASPLKYRTGEKTIMLHYDHTGNNGILFGGLKVQWENCFLQISTEGGGMTRAIIMTAR